MNMSQLALFKKLFKAVTVKCGVGPLPRPLYKNKKKATNKSAVSLVRWECGENWKKGLFNMARYFEKGKVLGF